MMPITKEKKFELWGGPNSIQLIDIVDNLGGKLYIIVGDLGYILLVGNLVPSTQSSTSHLFKFSLFFLMPLYIFRIRGVFINKILQGFDDFARYLFLGLAHKNKIKRKTICDNYCRPYGLQ